jgi:hypothetical protein
MSKEEYLDSQTNGDVSEKIELMHTTLNNKKMLGIFPKENRNLSQDMNGRPIIENTHIHIGEKRVMTWFLLEINWN